MVPSGGFGGSFSELQRGHLWERTGRTKENELNSPSLYRWVGQPGSGDLGIWVRQSVGFPFLSPSVQFWVKQRGLRPRWRPVDASPPVNAPGVTTEEDLQQEHPQKAPRSTEDPFPRNICEAPKCSCAQIGCCPDLGAPGNPEVVWFFNVLFGHSQLTAFSVGLYCSWQHVNHVPWSTSRSAHMRMQSRSTSGYKARCRRSAPKPLSRALAGAQTWMLRSTAALRNATR